MKITNQEYATQTRERMQLRTKYVQPCWKQSQIEYTNTRFFLPLAIHLYTKTNAISCLVSTFPFLHQNTHTFYHMCAPSTVQIKLHISLFIQFLEVRFVVALSFLRFSFPFSFLRNSLSSSSLFNFLMHRYLFYSCFICCLCYFIFVARRCHHYFISIWQTGNLKLGRKIECGARHATSKRMKISLAMYDYIVRCCCQHKNPSIVNAVVILLLFCFFIPFVH